MIICWVLKGDASGLAKPRLTERARVASTPRPSVKALVTWLFRCTYYGRSSKDIGVLGIPFLEFRGGPA